ncbi:hypothetical protein BCV71DRAFT_267507 [Rhizopus microsporus]|uniref:Uncharacterized protein n=1 Tax=Rhizopus microsporus TaxID=58291 RepID=A0A1X0RQW9_RHIZD|nr:hypothetical protein BCV71DRAFT_267507 [Rhizopus microsporus]
MKDFKLKTGKNFIRYEIVDEYYQAKYHLHDMSIPDFNDISTHAFLRSLEKTKRATYYILWNDKLHRIEKVLVVFENIALVMENVAMENLYYHEETIPKEQVGANSLAELKSKMDAIDPWIKLVTLRRQVDLELEKDEQSFQTVELKFF